MKKEDDNIENEKPFIITAIVVTVIVIGLWITTYYLLKDKCETDRGTFGDMFGSVNALFSGLALGGIILTILLQRNELKLQRFELRDTRKEFKTQNETLKLQRFEDTFFSMLNLHHQIVNAIDFRYYTKKTSSNQPKKEEKENITINGRDVFRHRYKSMIADIKKDPDKYESIYLKHYEMAQLDFGHYFRNLYRIIKLVDKADFFYSKKSVEEIFKIKYNYTSIVRAQLSNYELAWIFYNCLSINGIEKFKPFIEKYSLFKNLPKELLASDKHYQLYNLKAYSPEA